MSSHTIATPFHALDATKRPRARIRMGVAVLALASIGAARAETSGNVSLTSDYIFRGVSQTNQNPALQGGVEFAAFSGFYIGAWGSNVSWLSDGSNPEAPLSSSLELDVYGGYRGSVSRAVTFDVGGLYYWFPADYPAGFNSPDTFEVHAGIIATPAEGITLSAKYSYAVTDLFGYADSDGSGYLDVGANWEFSPGSSFTAHAGRQWIQGNREYAYTDWKLGITRAFDNGFSAGMAWSDTDADNALYTNPHGNVIADNAVVLTLAKAF